MLTQATVWVYSPIMVADALPPTKVRKRRPRIKKALAGAILATTDQTFDEVAHQVGAKNGNSLKRSLFKDGITREKLKPSADSRATMTLTCKVATDAAEMIREKLNGDLLGQAAALSTRPATFRALANRGQGRAATLETLSRTWRNLNGSPDSLTIQFGVERQGGLRSTPPVVTCGSVTDVTEQSTPPPVQDVGNA